MDYNDLSFAAKREADLIDLLLAIPHTQESKKMKFNAYLNLGNIEIEFEAKDRDEAEKYLKDLYVSISLDYVPFEEEIETELIDDNCERLENESSWILDD